MVVPGSCDPGIYAGMAALQLFYNFSTGLWDTTAWWNAANAMEVTIDYTRITDTPTYSTNIFHTFEKHKHTNFLNPWFNDDDGWWAITWIKAYDLTGNPRYLEMAKTIFHNMTQAWDETCGGGIWWKKDRTYKNAITNELLMTVAARLHLRTPGDKGPGSYLDWAQRTWKWFQQTGMINDQNLVNDGLDDACKNNQKTTWTYNQGVILGGLVDLYKSTNDRALLKQAEAIADAAIQQLAPNGVLREACEPDCGDDGPQFKGIFVRYLSYLYQTLPKPAYKAFIERNAAAVWQSRNGDNHFGLSWAGPFDRADAARQASALDALNAAIAVNTKVCRQADTRSSSGTIANLQARYPGSGYVAKQWDTQTVNFTVPVACAGNYNVTFRYAAAEGDASRYIHVNRRRQVDNQIFPGTATWSDWQKVTLADVWLNAGNNTIAVIFNQSKGSQQPLHLDQIAVH